MKRIYSLYAAAFALVLAGTVVLLTPPTTVYACSGTASCQYGRDVSVPLGASDCHCTDNVGCTWKGSDGKTYTQKCASKVGAEEELLIE
jgi:hypothetical protein